MARSTVTPAPLWGAWNPSEHTVEVEPVPSASLSGIRNVSAVLLDGEVIGYAVSQVNGRRTEWDVTTRADGWARERPVYGLPTRKHAIDQAVAEALRTRR